MTAFVMVLAAGMPLGDVSAVVPEAAWPSRDPEQESFARIKIGMSHWEADKLLREYGFTPTWGFVCRNTGGIMEYECASGTEIILTYKDFCVEGKWLKRGYGQPSPLWRERTRR